MSCGGKKKFEVHADPRHFSTAMDFQALLGQISELEAANIDERRKLLEESAKHKVRALHLRDLIA